MQLLTTKPRKLDVILLIISGFRQGRDTDHGMRKHYEEMCKVYFDRRTALVMLRKWNDPVNRLAEQIALHANPQSVVFIESFSWGGPTAVKIIKRLKKKYGIRVRHWFARDPIVRTWGFPFTISNAFAGLTRIGTFKRPRLGACATVSLFRQVNGAPYGRKITGVLPGIDPMQIVYGREVALSRLKNNDRGNLIVDDGAKHNLMDDSKAIHDEVVTRMDRTLKGRIRHE